MERENIARAAKGDANAFETLMSAYEKKIYALCLRMMGNPHDGEDAAQEACCGYGARSASIGLRARFQHGYTG